MKKTICLVALSALAIIISINDSAFAAADEKKLDSDKRETIRSMDDDDKNGNSGGSRAYYERVVFNIKITTREGGSVSLSNFEIEETYQNITLSCCVYKQDRNSTCDFIDDSSDCNKFIDRQKGHPYTLNNYYYR